MKNRWTTAQEYERMWWDSRKDSIDCDFYAAYASNLLSQIDGILSITPDTSILEIGSGAAGIITHLESNDRHAVDPLEDFFASVPHFLESRDSRVRYRTAKAEDLPFEDDRFDFIIIDNVLDHCADVDAVFSELRRVLRGGGIVYLRLSLYTPWGAWVRFLVEALKIDPGHPFTFTRKSLTACFRKHEFQICKREDTGFWSTWWNEIESLRIKEILKAISFSTPNKTLFILKKSADPRHEKG